MPPAPEDCIKALMMLVEPLAVLPEPNALLVLPRESRFLKNPSLPEVGEENGNAGAIVAGTAIPPELVMAGLEVATVRTDCQVQRFWCKVRL